NTIMKDKYSKNTNINKNKYIILITDIPKPSLITANLSYKFLRNILAAICQKKKYMPASILSEPDISPLKITNPKMEYKKAKTIDSLSLINCLINNTPVATGTT